MVDATLAGHSVTTTLLPGDSGTEQTIALIRNVVKEGLADPVVRATAGRIVGHLDSYNEGAEVRAIYEWVRRIIRFRRDPVGHETVSSARWILTHRFGDCDEINAVLLPSLLGVLGHRTRLVTVSSNPAQPEEFSHVYAEVLVRGNWIPVDAARPGAQFGAAPRRYFRKRLWSLTDAQFQEVQGLGGYVVGMDGFWDTLFGGVRGIITDIRRPPLTLPPIYQPPPPRYPSPLPPNYPPPFPSPRPEATDNTPLLLGAALIGGLLLVTMRK